MACEKDGSHLVNGAVVESEGPTTSWIEDLKNCDRYLALGVKLRVGPVVSILKFNVNISVFC